LGTCFLCYLWLTRRAAGDDVAVSANGTFAGVVGDLPFVASGPALPELMAENDRRSGVDLMADVVDTADAGVELFTKTRADLEFDDALRVATDLAPVPAAVVAFGLDERTVCAWLHKAGAHAALLHVR